MDRSILNACCGKNLWPASNRISSVFVVQVKRRLDCLKFRALRFFSCTETVQVWASSCATTLRGLDFPLLTPAWVPARLMVLSCRRMLTQGAAATWADQQHHR